MSRALLRSASASRRLWPSLLRPVPSRAQAFFQLGLQVSGDAECLGVVIARLSGVPGSGGQLAEAVQGVGLPQPLTAVGELLHEAKLVAGHGDAVDVADVAGLVKGVPAADGRGLVVAGEPLQDSELVGDDACRYRSRWSRASSRAWRWHSSAAA
jgi:hypothetical protein